jgi:hypothetical protein
MSTNLLTNKSLIQYNQLKNGATNLSSAVSGFLFKAQSQLQPQIVTQTRNNWGYKGRMMLKDIKRRELVRKYAPLRVRLQTIRYNSILPKVIKVR